MLLRPLLPLFLLSLAPSCAVYSAPMCQTGADCASGVCDADGACAPVSSTSSSGKGSSGSGSSGTGGAGGAGGGGVCSPSNDGVITRQQVPLQAGLHATFLVAENAGVSTAGTMMPDGSRTWDLSVTFSGDHAEPLETLPLAGQWFGKDFPGAAYAARLSDSSDLLGVFALTPSALQLVGVASPMASSTQTELHYSPAVTVLAFPLQAGATWSTISMVTGQAQGVPIVPYYNETYQSSVDAHGTLKTPYATFDVLRVNTLLTRLIAGVVTTTRTFTFVTDCFGSVASIVSNTDELVTEFTTAAEVTRLAP
jgi:hypothetical protein